MRDVLSWAIRPVLALCFLTLSLGVLVASTPSFAQKAKVQTRNKQIKSSKTPNADPVTDLAKGSKELGILALMKGKWSTSTKAWNEPGTAPLNSRGNAIIADATSAGFAVDDKGGPLVSSLGYDGAKKQYIMDLAGTLPSIGNVKLSLTGAYDAERKVLTFKGNSKDPKTSAPRTIKVLIKQPDGRTSYREVWVGRTEGKDGMIEREAKVMQITYVKETPATPPKS